MKKFKWIETLTVITIASLLCYILYWGFRFILYAWTI